MTRMSEIEKEKMKEKNTEQRNYMFQENNRLKKRRQAMSSGTIFFWYNLAEAGFKKSILNSERVYNQLQSTYLLTKN